MTQTGPRWNGTTTEDEDRQKWQTPDYLFNWLNDQFGPFTLDVAASEKNARCERYFTEEMNALKQVVNFGEKCFLNPPFNNIKPFIEWLLWQRDNMRAEFTVVLPSDLSTSWAELCINNASQVIHVTSGRVHYVSNNPKQNKNRNNKPTMICVFQPGDEDILTRYVSLKQIKARI